MACATKKKKMRRGGSVKKADCPRMKCGGKVKRGTAKKK